MSFEDYKKKALTGYSVAKRKGLVDKDIRAELDQFNKLENYYTTSSCSGRILLVRNTIGQNKLPDAFYYKTHEKTTPKTVIRQVRNYDEDFELWFKTESFILHIGCRTLEHARRLLALCKRLGLKRAGINAWGRRIIVEVMSTENIETIIVKDHKILVSDDYLKTLTNKGNKKLGETKARIHDFFKQAKSL